MGSFVSGTLIVRPLKCSNVLLFLPRPSWSITAPAKAIMARGVRASLCSSTKEGFETLELTASQKYLGAMTSLFFSQVAVTVVVVVLVVVDCCTVIWRGVKKATVASLVACFELHMSSSRKGSAKCRSRRFSSAMDSRVVVETMPLVFLLFQQRT